MTHPTNPPPPSTVEVALAALTLQGVYGAITDLARGNGISRQKVYKLRDTARAAVETAFAGVGTPKGGLTLTVTEDDIARTVVALRVVTPASIRDIVAMLPIIYGVRWSYGKVQGVLCRAQEMAAQFLAGVDLSGIDSTALDEMFSQGQAVFAGIDLDTQYLFQLESHPSRSGEEWAKALGHLRDKQHLAPTTVVKDAGSGLASGVQACWPGIEERDDLFHVVYRMGKEAVHLERRAYAAIAAEDALAVRVTRAKTEDERGRFTDRLQQAHQHTEHVIDQYDRYEVLRQQAGRVLELTDRGSGRLRTSGEVVDTLSRVANEMEALDGKRIRAVARYLRNRAVGLGRYLDGLRKRLDAGTDEAGGVNVVEAAVRAWQAGLEVSRGGPSWDHKARQQELVDAVRHILEVTGSEPERLQRAIAAVWPQLAERHRASSAIENLNSVLRPYLVVQKHAEQGFLDLFRFHWNTRTREWGRWKGTSAYEQLTGKKVDDWLTLLGLPPGPALAVAA
jgi:hypothetical protein